MGKENVTRFLQTLSSGELSQDPQGSRRPMLVARSDLAALTPLFSLLLPGFDGLAEQVRSHTGFL